MSQSRVDWSTQALRDQFLGRWVKVTGWMLFDVEHESEAENTAPGRPRNWRATAWEVHPVTAIEVVQRLADASGTRQVLSSQVAFERDIVKSTFSPLLGNFGGALIAASVGTSVE